MDISSKRGFTLMEMLFVSVLLGIIGIAVFTTLNNGLKIWQVLTRESPEEDFLIFSEKFSRDLKNGLRYTGMKFEGTPERVSFPAIITLPGTKNNTGIGQVTYFFDTLTQSVKKSQAGYSEVYQHKKPPEQILVKNIKNLTFCYYVYDEDAKLYKWKDKWQEEKKLPVSVKITAIYLDGKTVKGAVYDSP
ncbi:MAG: prepilin-type N-terminal cleavage/methylation domain-containing protein [Candidatus Omnitrophota bacterium]